MSSPFRCGHSILGTALNAVRSFRCCAAGIAARRFILHTHDVAGARVRTSIPTAVVIKVHFSNISCGTNSMRFRPFCHRFLPTVRLSAATLIIFHRKLCCVTTCAICTERMALKSRLGSSDKTPKPKSKPKPKCQCVGTRSTRSVVIGDVFAARTTLRTNAHTDWCVSTCNDVRDTWQ